jgi:hypothetical protein
MAARAVGTGGALLRYVGMPLGDFVALNLGRASGSGHKVHLVCDNFATHGIVSSGP